MTFKEAQTQYDQVFQIYVEAMTVFTRSGRTIADAQKVNAARDLERKAWKAMETAAGRKLP